MPQNPLNIPLGAKIGTAITSNTNTQVKTGPGVLTGMSVLTAGSSWQAAIYDGTSASGTPLYTVPLDTLGPVVFPPTRFTLGLFVVTSGTTAGSVAPLNF